MRRVSMRSTSVMPVKLRLRRNTLIASSTLFGLATGWKTLIAHAAERDGSSLTLVDAHLNHAESGMMKVTVSCVMKFQPSIIKYKRMNVSLSVLSHTMRYTLMCVVLIVTTVTISLRMDAEPVQQATVNTASKVSNASTVCSEPAVTSTAQILSTQLYTITTHTLETRNAPLTVNTQPQLLVSGLMTHLLTECQDADTALRTVWNVKRMI